MDTVLIETNQNASRCVGFIAPVQKRSGTNGMRNSSWRLSELTRQWQTTKGGSFSGYSLDVKGGIFVDLCTEYLSTMYCTLQSDTNYFANAIYVPSTKLNKSDIIYCVVLHQTTNYSQYCIL